MDKDKVEIIFMTQNAHKSVESGDQCQLCRSHSLREQRAFVYKRVISMQVVFNKVIGNSLLLLSVEAFEDVTACFDLFLLLCGQQQTQILLKENGKLIQS